MDDKKKADGGKPGEESKSAAADSEAAKTD